MESETGIDRLHRILYWADWQDINFFDGLEVYKIIDLFFEVTERQGIDMIEDMQNPTFKEWINFLK